MVRWQLPENLSDVLPGEALRLERARRALLDLYAGYGYELVQPPLVEHLDSLLTGTGYDLDLRTFKLVDQLSGRTLGVRPDITPQVARIDAHILAQAGVTRLCYAGATLHARPQHPLATREPFQVGAEVYGEGGTWADEEILELAVRSLRLVGAAEVQLDLGHSGILRELLAAAPAGLAEDGLIAALNAKDAAALDAALQGVAPAAADPLRHLVRLHGGAEVLQAARRLLPARAAISAALDELERIAARAGADRVGFDLSDLHGYRYHTGFSFAAFLPRLAAPAIRGGRYDDIGRAFGRARPATGFSILDLREVLAACSPGPAPAVAAIRAPLAHDAALDARVAALRAEGRVVVRCAAGTRLDGTIAFRHELRLVGGQWQVVAADDGPEGPAR